MRTKGTNNNNNKVIIIITKGTTARKQTKQLGGKIKFSTKKTKRQLQMNR